MSDVLTNNGLAEPLGLVYEQFTPSKCRITVYQKNKFFTIT